MDLDDISEANTVDFERHLSNDMSARVACKIHSAANARRPILDDRSTTPLRLPQGFATPLTLANAQPHVANAQPRDATDQSPMPGLFFSSPAMGPSFGVADGSMGPPTTVPKHALDKRAGKLPMASPPSAASSSTAVAPAAAQSQPPSGCGSGGRGGGGGRGRGRGASANLEHQVHSDKEVRGYKCSKCRQPKKGHVCPASPSKEACGPNLIAFNPLQPGSSGSEPLPMPSNGQLGGSGSALIVQPGSSAPGSSAGAASHASSASGYGVASTAASACADSPGSSLGGSDGASGSTDNRLELVPASELFGVGDAGAMDKGAFFRKDCTGKQFTEVQHEDILKGAEFEPQAHAWQKKSTDHYLTDCYVERDADLKDIFAIELDEDGKSGRKCTIEEVYDQCDDDIHTPGELPLTNLWP